MWVEASPPPPAALLYKGRDKGEADEVDFLTRLHSLVHPPSRPHHARAPPLLLHDLGTLQGDVLRPTTTQPDCSHVGCAWLWSWEAQVVVGLAVGWVLLTIVLLCLTRSSTGQRIIQRLSVQLEDAGDTEDGVTGKDIGYFEGSPGMRRTTETQDTEDLNSMEFEGFECTDDEYDDDVFVEDVVGLDEAARVEDMPYGLQRPRRIPIPRRGRYLLEETTKDYVLEEGTYKLQLEKTEYVIEGETCTFRAVTISVDPCASGVMEGDTSKMEGSDDLQKAPSSNSLLGNALDTLVPRKLSLIQEEAHG